VNIVRLESSVSDIFTKQSFTVYPDGASEHKNVFDWNVTQYFVRISCLAVKKSFFF